MEIPRDYKLLHNGAILQRGDLYSDGDNDWRPVARRFWGMKYYGEIHKPMIRQKIMAKMVM